METDQGTGHKSVKCLSVESSSRLFLSSPLFPFGRIPGDSTLFLIGVAIGFRDGQDSIKLETRI